MEEKMETGLDTLLWNEDQERSTEKTKRKKTEEEEQQKTEENIYRNKIREPDKY